MQCQRKMTTDSSKWKCKLTQIHILKTVSSSLYLRQQIIFPKDSKNRSYNGSLTLCLFPQPPNCAPHCHSTSSVQSVGTTSLDLPTVLAAPNSHSLPLHSKLPTELTEEFAVLTNFHFLNLLPQTSPISGTVLPNDAGLPRTLAHSDKVDETLKIVKEEAAATRKTTAGEEVLGFQLLRFYRELPLNGKQV
uniref:Uncharacterized protein n=1 Tax=Rhizophora mucronata TaxID=61149 RepID=A0A2P2KA31_RHIMU